MYRDQEEIGLLQKKANQLPLNFIDDLIEILQNKSQNLVIEKGLDGSAVIRINLFKSPEVSSKIPMVVLDPDIPQDLLSTLLDREVRIWDTPAVSSNTEVIQVVDGIYGISTLWNKKLNHPKRSFFRLYELIKEQVKDLKDDTLLVTWKILANWLKREQEHGELPPSLEIAHFGALEGLNDYNTKEQVIILGTPQISASQVEELAHAIYKDQDIDTSTSKQWREFNYSDSNGNKYSVKVRDYNDERLRQIAYLFREAEIIQCARRIRDLLSEGKKIVLMTNLPMKRLAPTRLTTVKTLKTEYGLTDDENISAKQFVAAKVEGIVEDAIKKSLVDSGEVSVQFITKEIYGKLMDGQDCSKDILEQCNPSTIERYIRDSFTKITSFFNLDSVKISIPGANGKGTVHLNVYAIGNVDEEKVKQQYRKWKLIKSRKGLPDKRLCDSTTEEIGEFIAMEVTVCQEREEEKREKGGLSPPPIKARKKQV